MTPDPQPAPGEPLTREKALEQIDAQASQVAARAWTLRRQLDEAEKFLSQLDAARQALQAIAADPGQEPAAEPAEP